MILLANSDAVDRDTLAALVKDHDTIVQFNRCIHAEIVATFDVKKIFYFGVPYGQPPFGFGEDCKAPTNLDGDIYYLTDEIENRYVLKATKDYGGQTAYLKSKIGAFNLRDIGFEPSTGYQVAIELAKENDIVLVGFTGEGGWIGHNFDLERLVLNKHPRITFAPDIADSDLSLIGAFKSTFDETYNFSSRHLKDLMCDLASAFFRAGESQMARRFLTDAACIHPSFERPLRELAILDEIDISEFIIPVELKRQFRKDKNGIDYEFARFEEIGSDFAYSRQRQTQNKRILIINNTAAIYGNKWHIGCKIVMQQILQFLNQSKMQCVGWFNSSVGLANILKLDPSLQGIDAVLINGEGTCHDDARRALEILLAATRIKHAFGKPVFFINGVWQNNSNLMAGMMRDMDLIAVRDRRSYEALEVADAFVCPDITWTTHIPEQVDKAGTAVIDSVNPEKSGLLSDLAQKHGYDYWVMAHYPREAYRTLKTGRSLPLVAKAAHDFGKYKTVITGRYHGACLALQAGCSVAFLPSNTYKTEAMFEDIGLSEKQIDDHRVSEFSEAEFDKIKKYKSLSTETWIEIFNKMKEIL